MTVVCRLFYRANEKRKKEEDRKQGRKEGRKEGRKKKEDEERSVSVQNHGHRGTPRTRQSRAREGARSRGERERERERESRRVGRSLTEKRVPPILSPGFGKARFRRLFITRYSNDETSRYVITRDLIIETM